MKALEFESKLVDIDQMRVSPEFASQILNSAAVRLILLFGSGARPGSIEAQRHSPPRTRTKDAVYEQLIDGPSAG
jgi:hypothetical protein